MSQVNIAEGREFFLARGNHVTLRFIKQSLQRLSIGLRFKAPGQDAR